MTIENKHIIDCPEHGLFWSPNYKPCPQCYCDDPILEGPMCWSTTFIQWKDEERPLTLAYRPSLDPTFKPYVLLRQSKRPTN